MKEYRAVLNNPSDAPSRFDTVIEWLLVSLLVFMPLAFGVVHAWSEEVVVVLSGAIVICFLLRLIFCGGRGIVWSWSYVPVTLLVLLVVLQLVPLPANVVSLLSPNTVALKTELLGDLPNADQVLDPMTLSFYPRATEHDLRLVLSIAAVFVIVLNVFRRPDQIKRLLTAMVLIGGVFAAVAVAQNLFGNGKIYWFVYTRSGGAHSGPFVNHNNYGQFMNLSIGAATALLCVKLHEVFGGVRTTLAGVVEYLSCGSAKSFWLLLAMMSLCMAGVFISLTRGGVVSILFAMAFTTLLFASRQSLRNHGWIMIVMALVAFGVVLYVGFDAVYDRLATLRDLDKAEGGRLQILKDIWVLWNKFPVFGTGLGTHLVVYPMFDRSTVVPLAAHAENEYAQAAEETGLLGLGLLVVFGVIVWRGYARSIRNTHSSIHFAAYGLGFGLFAILVHSLSDFGQHLPANATLSATFCALLLVLAQQRPAAYPEASSAPTRWYRVLLPCALLPGAVLIWTWAVTGADDARVANSYWQEALRLETSKNWQGSEQQYADLIGLVGKAVDREPQNVEYRHELNLRRWSSISQLADPEIGTIAIPDDSMPTVRSIIEESRRARALCPTYGPIYSMVGQIERLVLNDNSGAAKIRKGFRLAQCSPAACFAAGCLDIVEGNNEDGIRKLDRAIQLDGGLFSRIADVYAYQLNRPHLAIEAAGDDIGRLGHVVHILEDMQYDDLAEQTRKRIEELLIVECSQPDTPAAVFISLGDIYRKKQDTKAAIDCYRRALTLDYGHVHWRLQLARLLAEARRIPEAMQEARRCLQVSPRFEAAEKLIEDLSVHPAMLAEDVESY